jgi:hypothetical protein
VTQKDLARLKAIEKRALRPAWNWKALTMKDVPWLIAKVRESGVLGGPE